MSFTESLDAGVQSTRKDNTLMELVVLLIITIIVCSLFIGLYVAFSDDIKERANNLFDKEGIVFSNSISNRNIVISGSSNSIVSNARGISVIQKNGKTCISYEKSYYDRITVRNVVIDNDFVGGDFCIKGTDNLVISGEGRELVIVGR